MFFGQQIKKEIKMLGNVFNKLMGKKEESSNQDDSIASFAIGWVVNSERGKRLSEGEHDTLLGLKIPEGINEPKEIIKYIGNSEKAKSIIIEELSSSLDDKKNTELFFSYFKKSSIELNGMDKVGSNYLSDMCFKYTSVNPDKIDFFINN